jgi:hypothetical protein
MDWTGIPFEKLPDLEDTTRKAFRWQQDRPGIYGERPEVSSLSTYAGLLIPDAISTENNIQRGFQDINPLVSNKPGLSGIAKRAAYFGGSTALLSKIEDKLAKINPILPKLMQAYIGGIQKQMLKDNTVFGARNLRDNPNTNDGQIGYKKRRP